jgi:nucleotide-binding universal stress UspA family protein
MFKHLLLTTDGSPAAEAAIQKGIDFAKSINARITGVHVNVVPEYHVMSYRTAILEDTRKQFLQDCKEHAAKFLAMIEAAAKSAGVECDTAFVIHDDPYEGILKTAAERGCDLIVMASHGRKGVKGLLTGSETQKVLAHSPIPVLVFR